MSTHRYGRIKCYKIIIDVKFPNLITDIFKYNCFQMQCYNPGQNIWNKME